VVSLPEEAADHEALGRLWARSRIHRLEREMHDGERPDVREAITRLGLTHRLLTPWTSLVAVDSMVSNPGGAAAGVNVPVEMPEDVSYEGVFGLEARRSTLLPKTSLIPGWTSAGVSTGVATGAQGGMEGGVEGGVVGGVIGGVVGGVVGGVSGGLLGSEPLQAGIGGVTNPELIPESRVQPRYPEIARKAKVAGRVILQAIVRQDGSVGEIQVLSSPGKRFGFDEAAIEAVRQWRYKPGLQNGKPVDVYFTVVVDFPLQASDSTSTPLDRLILVHSDGTRIIVEQDGEVWKIEDRRRTLARTLSASEIGSFRTALAQSRPENWPGATSGARIVLEAGSARQSVPLPTTDPAILALLGLIEHWAS
jgi:TonB family protein